MQGGDVVRLSQVDCECPDDFMQYYKGRWFAVPDGDKLIPCTLQGVQGSKITFSKIVNGDNGHLDLASTVDEWRNLRKVGRFGMPMLGNIVDGDTYEYLWSFARRQSIKGYSSEAVSRWSPDMYGLGAIHEKTKYKPASNSSYLTSAVKELQRKYSNLLNVYNPKHYTLEEAIKLLEEGARIGCPITPQVGLHLAETSPFICVSHRFRTIGWLTSPKKVELFKNYKYLEDILKLSLPGVSIKV